MSCENGCQQAIDDNAEVVQTLLPAVQPPTNPEESTRTPSLGPPTPQSIEVGGDLPTIHEDNEESDDNQLIVENFYAELMSDIPLQPDPLFEELHGDMHPLPVQMMPEDTVIFMAKGDDDRVLRGDMLLESAETYISDFDMSAENQTIDSDEIGTYVELCFTAAMAPIVLDEDQHNKLQCDEIATMRVYISANTKRACLLYTSPSPRDS